MLWPIILPAKITLVVLAIVIGLLTVVAPSWKWRQGRTFAISLLMAIILFIPSCVGIMSILDFYRFGTFRYASYSDVQDVRVERYLPTTATDITVIKYPTGHVGRYSVPEADLQKFVDALWKKSGQSSVISREEFGKSNSPRRSPSDGEPRISSEFEINFPSTGWPKPKTWTERPGPVAADGGRAIDFYDPTTQTAYQRGGYW